MKFKLHEIRISMDYSYLNDGTAYWDGQYVSPSKGKTVEANTLNSAIKGKGSCLTDGFPDKETLIQFIKKDKYQVGFYQYYRRTYISFRKDKNDGTSFEIESDCREGPSTRSNIVYYYNDTEVCAELILAYMENGDKFKEKALKYQREGVIKMRDSSKYWETDEDESLTLHMKYFAKTENTMKAPTYWYK